MDKRIIIIGAGPTGLGAAYRLKQLGHSNWRIYEKDDHVGGLSSSFCDDRGFTWDLGGHVLFSHYSYFDELAKRLLGDEFNKLIRESWIYLLKKWIPYPFQNNIRYLPPAKVIDCLSGLYQAAGSRKDPRNFEQWVLATFGHGIGKLFMLPYNYKVWATPPDLMDKNWISERVSVVKFKRILSNVMLKKDDVDWGPNYTFDYPQKGGTGALFNAFLPYIQNNLHLNSKLRFINTKNRSLEFNGGASDHYDLLINTMPIDKLVRILEPTESHMLKSAAMLKHNSVLVVGIGIEKPSDDKRCWMYFPEYSVPFYRVTNFSHYSRWNVPEGDISRYSSFLCETSASCFKKENEHTIIERTVDGLIKCGLIKAADRKFIASKWLKKIAYAYPIPSLQRDRALARIQPMLMSMAIYSRGRFGAWKYEVANMDHSVMMGVEAVNHLLRGTSEPTVGFRSGEASTMTTKKPQHS